MSDSTTKGAGPVHRRKSSSVFGGAPHVRHATKPSPRRRVVPPQADKPHLFAQPSASSSTFNLPAIWTKDSPHSSSLQPNSVPHAFGAIGRTLLMLLTLIGRGIVLLVKALFSLLAHSRVALATFLIVTVALIGGLVDFNLNADKVYSGVRVGEIDAAGKTAEELTALIDETYGSRLDAGSVVIYANEEAALQVKDEIDTAQDVALAEQVAVEEARANKQAWATDATTLHARVPSTDLAAEALAIGRGNGGIVSRIGAFLFGYEVTPRASYGEEELEALAADIDETIGDPRVDYDISISDGSASVVSGHDGYMVDRVAFARSLDQVLLTQSGEGSFIAQADYAALRIDEAAANAVCDKVNTAIANGARFTYSGLTWDLSASDVGEWITTRIDEVDGGFALVAFVDEAKAKPELLANVKSLDTGDPLQVSFSQSDGMVTVLTNGSGMLPLVSQAVSSLDAALFGEGGKATVNTTTDQSPVQVFIESGAAPTSLSLDEALDLGIIGTISSYTTEFTTAEGTENRNHNIALAAELLNNSIVKPGGRWSFNAVAGECNAERGFRGAGAIISGEYDDAVGGGICQVATTMFNAVFDAGYPVPTRHNHSLHISSYPEGRDAAVSWPDLDLVWENDGDDDVLVCLSCTDGSITATLYGVDPGYRVSSKTGEWLEGEHYSTKTTVDDALAPGMSYIKTRGVDGSAITVIRTVTDEVGAVLHEDVFASAYEPVTEIVVEGPSA